MARYIGHEGAVIKDLENGIVEDLLSPATLAAPDKEDHIANAINEVIEGELSYLNEQYERLERIILFQESNLQEWRDGDYISWKTKAQIEDKDQRIAELEAFLNKLVMYKVSGDLAEDVNQFYHLQKEAWGLLPHEVQEMFETFDDTPF